MKKVLKLSTAALLASAVSASAAIIDFTEGDPPQTGPFVGSVGGVSWTLSGEPNQVITPNVGPAPGAATFNGLAGDNDGVGIGSNEIRNGPAFATLTFSEEVKLVGTFFLNLFQSNESDDLEHVYITVGATPGAIDHEIFAEEVFEENFGFKYDNTKALKGTVFTFFAGPGNDDVGRPDFSLAAVELAPVPLPAGLLLMGTALGGLGLMRRKKKA